MSFLAFSGLANSLTCVVVGLWVFLARPTSRINKLYFWLNISVALYSTSYFFWQMSVSYSGASFWFKLLFCGVILINVTYLHFVSEFLSLNWIKESALPLLYLVNGIFIILTWSNLIFTGLEPRFGHGLWPIPTAVFNAYLVFWGLECLLGFISLWKGLQRDDGEQIKYFMIAAAFGFV